MALLSVFPADMDDDTGPGNFNVDYSDVDSDEGADEDQIQEEMDLLEDHGLARSTFRFYTSVFPSFLAIFVVVFLLLRCEWYCLCEWHCLFIDIARSGRQQRQRLLAESKEELINRFEVFADRLPMNTLDVLVDKLGGPTKVAEVFHILQRFFSSKIICHDWCSVWDFFLWLFLYFPSVSMLKSILYGSFLWHLVDDWTEGSNGQCQRQDFVRRTKKSGRRGFHQHWGEGSVYAR